MDVDVAFQELSIKHMNSLKLLRQVRGKQLRTRQELAAARAVREQLSQQGEGRCFRAVGRAFFLDDRSALDAAAEQQVAQLSADADKYEKQNVFLMGQVRETEKQLGELLRARGVN